MLRLSGLKLLLCLRVLSQRSKALRLPKSQHLRHTVVWIRSYGGASATWQAILSLRCGGVQPRTPIPTSSKWLFRVNLCLPAIWLIPAVTAVETEPEKGLAAEPGSPPPAAPPPHPSVMKMRAIMLIVNDCLMRTPLLTLGSSPDTLRPEMAQPWIFLEKTCRDASGKARLNCWGKDAGKSFGGGMQV